MSLRLLHNPRAVPVVEPASFDPPSRAPLSLHRRLPSYARTPLVDAPLLAARLGARRVLVKDESSRLDLPSYKILGASWAIYREVLEVSGLAEPAWSTVGELRTAFASLGRLTLAAATDGNHGRAVAHVAALLGWRAVIYVPAGTAPARIGAIESEGATVTVVAGTYDEAVQRAALDASGDTLVISDTAWPGYDRVPRRVIEGYSTIFWEIEDDLAERGLDTPSVVVIPVGVGALASAAVLHYRIGERAARRSRLVAVEPLDAACVLESVAAGTLREVPGPHRSIMAGLNCGRPSPLAVPLVEQGFDHLLAVEDDAARDAMRALAESGVESGESGAAGLAGLLVAVAEGRGGELGLSPESTVLLISTEGATDPQAYAETVGASAKQVAAGRRRG